MIYPKEWFQPLHKSSNRKVFNPPVSFFLDKIKNNEFFTMVRFQDKFWGVINQAINKSGLTIVNTDVKNDNHLSKISKEWINYWRIRTSRILPYIFSYEIIKDNIDMIVSKKPNNFYLSAEASADFPAKVINHLVPKDEILYFSTVWRMASKHQAIEKLFEQNKNTKIIFIAPYYYKNFGEKLGLNDFTHIEISHFEAVKNIHNVLNEVKKNHRKVLGEHDKVIYIIIGGATGAWLATKMHGLEKSFILEMGRALDIYYCHDNIRKRTPAWMWPTAWFQAIGQKHTNWTKRYKR